MDFTPEEMRKKYDTYRRRCSASKCPNDFRDVQDFAEWFMSKYHAYVQQWGRNEPVSVQRYIPGQGWARTNLILAPTRAVAHKYLDLSHKLQNPKQKEKYVPCPRPYEVEVDW